MNIHSWLISCLLLGWSWAQLRIIPVPIKISAISTPITIVSNTTTATVSSMSTTISTTTSSTMLTAIPAIKSTIDLNSNVTLVANITTSTTIISTTTESPEECVPNLPVLADASFVFAVSKSCKILVSSGDMITPKDLDAADTEGIQNKGVVSMDCVLVRPALFSVSSDELGIVQRINQYGRSNLARYAVWKLDKDWTEPRRLEAKAQLEIEFQLNSTTERSCHFHWKLQIIRCLFMEQQLDPFKSLEINYTDYEGSRLRVYKKMNWTIPKGANIARHTKEILAYYDEFLGTDRIWMQHSLQWMYNVDLEEQIKRGTKTSRLTMFHLANLERERTNIIPVYSDSSGLVTAHCRKNETDCRYIYSRIDAKSDMESTCLMELPYLTTIGVITPPRSMDLNNTENPLPPEAQVDNLEKVAEEDDPFGPLYILVLLTFFLILGTAIGHLIPSKSDDLLDLYTKLEEEIDGYRSEAMCARKKLNKKEDNVNKPK